MTVKGSMDNKGLSELQELEVKQFVVVIGSPRQHDALAVFSWRITTKPPVLSNENTG